ncbi:S9 family peptidase [Salinimicrobium sp. MT39]|uniref:S9 family peptidase n=1 Tax=Salinimicrobium profundisediminis TaxID=2994553 RepID=A0A9X3CYR9_9FLAO|nr:S9 family peptidase [Salinimicrobium profundisediminis]MCX2839401.1 S9 family peptidase [Salinimicrobium profundisediminis]
MNKKYFLYILAFLSLQAAYAQTSDLTVEKIMQDPSWMGTFPSNVQWGPHSEYIYFNYNPDNSPADSLYRISRKDLNKIEKVSWQDEQKLLPQRGDFNQARNKKVYTRDGDLFLYDLRKKKEEKLLELSGSLSDPQFLYNENKISFVFDNNAFVYDLSTGKITQLTNIQTGSQKEQKDKELSAQDQWLQDENLQLLEEVRKRKENKEAQKTYRDMTAKPEVFTFYTGDKHLRNLQVSPNGEYVTFQLITTAEAKDTDVPDYTNLTGYTVNLPARSKVGSEQAKLEAMVYNLEKDTVFKVDTENLPGIKDLPDFVKDYPDKEWEEEVREVYPNGAWFSNDGNKAVMVIRSKDNKDRWIAALDPKTGSLKSLDRQRDEAWISGPGIGYSWSGGNIGWLNDNKTIYFQSEETGYSHLYLLDVNSGKKTQLTKGDFEVFDPILSNDGKSWYLTTSEVNAGQRHFYKMPVSGGKMQQLTTLTGNNEVSLSPDEDYMAIRYSYSNKPWELYLKKTSASAEAKQVTTGQSEEFQQYNWREPELVKFEATDGAMVPARLYKPSAKAKNGAAVVFVHGAGYLQNAHSWWSSYFREYMFHNLLADLGYTVLDIDYRGSAGYGRDWRTGIYRHMGGKDLSDQVDGVKYLIAEHGVNPEKVGIYGGSYGGFITLMAMFTEAETFESGAALRSVTDWAHYNHGYTSNILNEPVNDPIAYRRSSPIYFAEGLEGNLLIAHGMIDVNVHFQDVVRLAQRLIELKKENWEMAVYPVEDHGFTEPSSWTDEYRRILKLFNETLLD